MIAQFGTALLCSLDSLIFATSIGLLGDPGIKRRNLSLAFGIFDFAGSTAGFLQYPSARFAHSSAAFQLLLPAYLALILLLNFPKALRTYRMYFVPALLSLDNLMQPISGVPFVFTIALASGVTSWLFAFAGLWLGEMARSRLYLQASVVLKRGGSIQKSSGFQINC